MIIVNTLSNENLWDIKSNLLLADQENLSKKYYHKILSYDLILKQNYENVMELPCLDKIVLNTTSKTYTTDKKSILFTLTALELISGQKPQLTYARKSIAYFKIRQHQIIGCKVVLRETQMYTFLDKLSKIIFPRIRDYSKKKAKNQLIQTSNTKNLNSSLNFGFQNLMIFPELENNYELVDNFRGMNLTFVFLNSDKITSQLVLSGFQLPLYF